jgi:cell division protein FtsL
MRIADDSVRNAVEIVVCELEAQEAMIATLQNQVQSLEIAIETDSVEIHKLKEEVIELSTYVKELETALAEAHLMDSKGGETT